MEEQGGSRQWKSRSELFLMRSRAVEDCKEFGSGDGCGSGCCIYTDLEMGLVV